METQEMLEIMWIGLFVLFVALEIASPGFVMLPFGLGALVAAGVAFLDVGIVGQLAAFLVASTVFFIALRPIGRKLNSTENPSGVGANRLVGETGTVIEPITTETGLIRIDREEWRADTEDGTTIPKGAVVTVVEVRGTRVLVELKHTSVSNQGEQS